MDIHVVYWVGDPSAFLLLKVIIIPFQSRAFLPTFSLIVDIVCRDRKKRRGKKKRRRSGECFGIGSVWKTPHNSRMLACASFWRPCFCGSTVLKSIRFRYVSVAGWEVTINSHTTAACRIEPVGSPTPSFPPVRRRKYLGDDASFRHLAALVVQARSQGASHRVDCSTVVRNGQRNSCGTFSVLLNSI